MVPSNAAGGAGGERALVRLVRLGEAQRHVQRERQLEQDESDLLPLPPRLEDRHELAVVPDRLIERVLEPGLVARSREVHQGLVLIVRSQPVVCEQPGDLVFPTGIGLLEPRGRFAVQPDALLGHQGAICGLLDERVLEAELRLWPAPGLTHQVETLEVQ